MKYLSRTLMIAGVFGMSFGQVVFSTTSVQAAKWSHSTSASVQRCKELRNDGDGYWKGTFRLQPPNLSAPNQPVFIVSDCFASKSECDRFISNARYRAPGFVENRYYGCKRKR